MKYFSTFTGIGGFEIGIDNAHKHVGQQNTTPNNDVPTEWGIDTLPTCVGYSEIDKYAIKVYERHFPNVRNYGDITKINADTLPDFDCLVGGFPCQAFSIAGKRAGFNDTRGTLFFDLARILKVKKPRLFVFENVKGLLSHDNGNTFRTIISTIDELGYDCQWQVLNSKNHGVPQNRERVIIVGHLRGTPRPEVFPITGDHTEDSKRRIDAAGINNPSRGYEIRRDGLASSLRATEMGSKNFIADIRQLNHPTHSNDRVYGEDGISPSLNTMQGGLRQPFIAPVLTPDRLVKRQNGRRFKENGEPSFTLTGQDIHGIYDGIKIRRLTPLECERLQAFPDNWTALDQEGRPISDTQRYKMCGNAVTTNVIRDVFERILL